MAAEGMNLPTPPPNLRPDFLLATLKMQCTARHWVRLFTEIAPTTKSRREWTRESKRTQ
jgi:hypothetical protein